jgi:hypothetical protein
MPGPEQAFLGPLCSFVDPGADGGMQLSDRGAVERMRLDRSSDRPIDFVGCHV